MRYANSRPTRPTRTDTSFTPLSTAPDGLATERAIERVKTKRIASITTTTTTSTTTTAPTKKNGMDLRFCRFARHRFGRTRSSPAISATSHRESVSVPVTCFTESLEWLALLKDFDSITAGSLSPMFSHLRNLRMVRRPPVAIIQERFTLDNIAAYNIDVDIGDSKTSSIVTLREVPSFLIEAFSRIGQMNGCATEGIFRKEGASARTKDGALPVFFGSESIPAYFLVHDICSWIKKFFRELKVPLFYGREQNLLKFADTFQNDPNGLILFSTIMSLLDRLPASHMGALSYLMRCLREISEQADVHHMTAENLATVFAPSLFRGHGQAQGRNSKSRKKRNGSQDDLLSTMKKMNELQVLVVQVLIVNAEKLGVPKDCYKASRRPSDLKKKPHGLIPSSVEKTCGKPATTEKPNPPSTLVSVTPTIRTKHSRSTNNLNEAGTSAVISMPVRSVDDDDIIRKRSKGHRSNSVVRAFGIFKNLKKSMTNLNAEPFCDTPDPPGLVSKRIPRTSAPDQRTTPAPSTPVSKRTPRSSAPDQRIPISPLRSDQIVNFKAVDMDPGHSATSGEIATTKKPPRFPMPDRFRPPSSSRPKLEALAQPDCCEQGRPSIAWIQGSGVVNRRIKHFNSMMTFARP